MNYGKDKENIATQNEKEIDGDIKNIMLNKMEKTIEKPKEQLYLNTRPNHNIIKILFNILENFVLTPIKEKKQKIITIFMRHWATDSTARMKELIWFILIHGSLGASIGLSALVILNSDLSLIQAIRNSMALTFVVLVIGTGSAYYLFEDINKILKENWGRKAR